MSSTTAATPTRTQGRRLGRALAYGAVVAVVLFGVGFLVRSKWGPLQNLDDRIIEATTSRDPFADPFTDGLSADRRPCLVLLDDGNNDPLIRADHGRLVAAAERADVRVSVVQHRSGSDVDRYAALLQTGMFAAVYLSVGLRRTPAA